MTERMSIGLIGLGNAGQALAKALCLDFQIYAYDLDAKRLDEASALGCKQAISLIDVAMKAEIIVLSLPTPGATRAVCQGLVETRLAGKLVIETSTVAPSDIEWMVDFLKPHGASVMDSAIVGGVQRLAKGESTFLVGASEADYERAEPVLSTAADEIFRLGPAGSGMRAKLVNNAVAHTTMVVLLEGAALARKVGVPMDVYYSLMSRESGLMRPLTHRFGERIKNQDFKAGMSTINASKDSTLALDLAHELGVPLFTMQASHTVYDIAKAEGLGHLDYASISKLWERWLDINMGYGDE